MKKVYGYIRVSTVKQGTGVSLQEQKEAIIRYAENMTSLLLIGLKNWKQRPNKVARYFLK